MALRALLHNAALKARRPLMIWLDKGMQWQWCAPANGKRGRQRTFSDAAIQLCLGIKCLFGLALHQSLGLVDSLLRPVGLYSGCTTTVPCAGARRSCRWVAPA